MRTRLLRTFFSFALLAALPAVFSAQGLSNLTDVQASGGIKEALARGVSAAIAATGRAGGFEGNPLIKIVFPEKLRLVEKALRASGLGGQVDKFEHSMNSAAEQAAPAARDIFLKALREMTIEDAIGIVRGGPTAGTEYFRRKTSDEIKIAFRPIVHKTMMSNGVTEKYEALMSKAPFGVAEKFDLDNYVLNKATDGLFYMMG